MFRPPYLSRLEACQEILDTEAAHSIAENVLCELLTELGYEKVVQAYHKLRNGTLESTGTITDYIMDAPWTTPKHDDDLVSLDPETGKITSVPMTASQEIRARALECAVRLFDTQDVGWITARAAELEAYIRDGK